jgi:cellobiose-specific phosphotransferase system component IIA
VQNPTPAEIRVLLDQCGRAALLLQMHNFSPEAQEKCYQAIEKVDNQKFEQVKLEIQKEANKIALAANKRSGYALLLSLIAGITAALSLGLTYIRG